jgi:hypothetical protein
VKSSRSSHALWLALALCVFLPGAVGAGTESPVTFPSAGMDIMTHQITVGLYQVGPNGELGNLLETLEFKGRMLLERGDPFLNEDLGRRQVDFVVKSWEADAWSEKLNTLVVYKLSDVEQKTSTITAEQKESDFPARIHFNVTFDTYVYEEPIITEYVGEPDGGSFMEVPPSGNRRTSPTITRFDTGRIETDHPTLGRLRFVPIACNDETGETLVTYTEEAKRLLKLRAPRAARKPASAPASR